MRARVLLLRKNAGGSHYDSERERLEMNESVKQGSQTKPDNVDLSEKIASRRTTSIFYKRQNASIIF